MQVLYESNNVEKKGGATTNFAQAITQIRIYTQTPQKAT